MTYEDFVQRRRQTLYQYRDDICRYSVVCLVCLLGSFSSSNAAHMPHKKRWAYCMQDFDVHLRGGFRGAAYPIFLLNYL